MLAAASPNSSRSALRIVLLYAGFSSLWILLSDRLVVLLVSDPEWMSIVNILKGWAFVAVTSLLLFQLIRGTHHRLLRSMTSEFDALREKRRAMQLLETMAENTTDIVFFKDEAGRYEFVNPGLATQLGRSVEEIIGRDDRDLYPADEARRLRANDQAVMHSNQVHEFEEVITTRHGVRSFMVTKGPMRGADGSIVGVFGVSHDVTERRADEVLLRKLSLAIEQSPESIVITDIDARIEYVNEAFLSCTGYGREELLGNNMRILKSGKTPPETYEKMWAAITAGQSWKGEFINRTRDGQEFVEFAMIAPLRERDGTVTHFVAIKEDTTEKKRLGAELDRYRNHLEDLVASRTRELQEAQQRAEAASQAKSAFLANMSHEIRTPINAIIGLTHLLRRGEIAVTQVARLDKIDDASRHLLSVINDILDLSKIEADRLQLEDSPFYLSSVIDSVGSIVGLAAREKGLLVRLDHGDVPMCLRGDPTRLRQALLNFAGNAVKFTDRGTVDIRTRLLDEEDDRLTVRFEVIDTGIGIAPEDIGRLFQVFEQADSSTTRKHGGTGLGLAISQRLAWLMGGEAGVESQLGLGSTFWFTARLRRGPVGQAVVEVGPAAGDAEAQLRKKYFGVRILLVEDTAVNREVASDLLGGAGLDIDTAEDGLDAVDKARASRYDLILMDMQMPRMNGLEATRAIRHLPGYTNVPIIAMTANVFDEDRHACEEAGMNDFISKPADPGNLFRSVLLWLSAGGVPVREHDDREDGGAGRVVPEDVADEDPETLLRLSRMSGMDVGHGLSMMRGNRTKYIRLLGDFVERHRNDPRRLAECLAQRDVEGGIHIAHTLKGTGATLGADSLADAAARLVVRLRNDPPGDFDDAEVRADLDTIETAFSSLMTALPHRSAGACPEMPKADPAQLAVLLRELKALLADDDTAAVGLYDRYANVLSSAFGEPGELLGQQIRNYDFENARLRVQSLLDSAPK